MNLPSFDFTNWREHPSDSRYTIFFYKTQNESDYFRELLKTNNIWFEYNYEESEANYKHYFAVNKTNEKEVIKLNHLSIGEYRKPFIGNNILRYIFVIVMFSILALAIISYIKSS